MLGSMNAEHSWRTMSTHPTSEGRVCYQRCACGRWRVTLAAWAGQIQESNHIRECQDSYVSCSPV